MYVKFYLYIVLSVFDLFVHALVKEVLDQIAKTSHFDFLQVDSNKSKTRSSFRSLFQYIPKIKTQTQKSLRFSINKMFNCLAFPNLSQTW